MARGRTGGATSRCRPRSRRSRTCTSSCRSFPGSTDLSADAGPDGAGDHARASGTFLTGVRIKKTAGSDIHAGISIDQVVANQIGHLTRFSSLELTCDAVRKSGDCDSGYACAYEYNLAWRSPNQPLSPEHNPRFVFERLFGGGSPRERVAQSQAPPGRSSIRSSISCSTTRARVNAKLDGRDKQKLDQYLTSVREIETAHRELRRACRSRTPTSTHPPASPTVTRSTSRSCSTCCCSRSRPTPRASPRCSSRAKAAIAASPTSASPRAITISRITRTARRSSRR